MPALSIGLPVFNGEEHLRPTLECLVGQTFGDFEIVVSDNCSTDGTLDIVGEFAKLDPRIRLIELPENKGALFNFTHVLEQATGEFFMWRAYDDVTDSNYLEVLVRGLQDNPDAALSAPAVERRRLDGTTSARMEFPNLDRLGRTGRVRKLLKTVSAGWMYGIYRRAELTDVFDRIITAYPHPWAQDHLIILHFLLNDRIVGCNETTFFQLETGKSAEAYRPKTRRGQWSMARDFLSTAFSELNQSRLTQAEKISLAPALWRYTDGKTDKYRRLVRRLIK